MTQKRSAYYTNVREEELQCWIDIALQEQSFAAFWHDALTRACEARDRANDELANSRDVNRVLTKNLGAVNENLQRARQLNFEMLGKLNAYERVHQLQKAEMVRLKLELANRGPFRIFVGNKPEDRSAARKPAFILYRGRKLRRCSNPECFCNKEAA